MKKKRWTNVLTLLFLLLISGAARVIYVLKFMDEITVSDSLIQRTWITGNELLHNIEFTLDDIYSACLSYAMLFYGNKAIVGVGVNIVLQLLSILFIYLCIRTVSDAVAAFIPSLVIGLLPMYLTMVSNISSFSMLIVSVSFVLWFALTLIKGIVTGIYSLTHRKDKQEDAQLEAVPDDEKGYLSEEELSEESYYEDDDEVDDDIDEPVEYLESIGHSWDRLSENDMISEYELGALISKKETTLYELDRLEEKYKNEYVPETSTESEQIEEAISEEDAKEELATKEPEQEPESEVVMEPVIEEKDEECIKEEQVQANQVQEKQVKEEPKRRERDTSFDDELDFTRYDIEDMSGMDFFDIE